MTDVASVLDGLDLLVGRAEGLVHPDDLDRARRGARDARSRRGYLGGILVMAIVGGTGSGKSSLLNALAGEQVASVSATRPHTRRPLAWIPEPWEPSLTELLDRLGIEDRVTNAKFSQLALLDATDIDSIDPRHRAQVEALLPEVDGVIWVLDPVKYRDPNLHDQFIAPLADAAGQFVFVLNQIDRLPQGEVATVTSDLVAALRADGIKDAAVFAVAADPPHGVPQGIGELASYLEERLDAKRIGLGKVLADARRLAREVGTAAGVAGGGSLEFEQRWARLIDAIVTAVSLAGRTPGVFEEALCGLEDFVGHVAAEAGGPFGLRFRNTFTSARLDEELREAVDRMERVVPRPPPRRDGRARPIDPEDRARAADVLSAELQQRVGAPMRKVVWERASLSATMAGVIVDVESAEQTLQG